MRRFLSLVRCLELLCASRFHFELGDHQGQSRDIRTLYGPLLQAAQFVIRRVYSYWKEVLTDGKEETQKGICLVGDVKR